MADGYISQIKLPNEETYDFRDRNLKVYTGSCSTAAGTAIKDVTTDGAFTLVKGAIVFVNFTNTNSAAVANLKLRVNSSAAADAKPVKYLYNGNDPANIPAVGYLRANQTYMFRYDGTNWVADLGYDTNTQSAYGNISTSGTLQTNDITIANGDKLVVTDASDSNKVARASVAFDGSTKTKALTQAGTWETFNNYSHPTTSGNKHIPSGGSSGQFLGWDSDGTAKWVANPNTDAKVAQTGNAEDKDFPILIKNTNNTTDETAGVKYSNNITDNIKTSKPFTYNPSTATLKVPKVQVSIQDDNYGLFPQANNWNQIGSSSLYWYRAYINNYYGGTSNVTNWAAGNNIGRAATSSAASALGTVNFYNTTAAGGTQTKTLLTADAATSANITVTLPNSTGTLALVSQIPTNLNQLTNGPGYVTSSGVTSITIKTTSPVSGGSNTATTSTGTYTISLADNYGDTKNPYASKTKNYVLAAPSTANGAPTFRALVAADIPALAYVPVASNVSNDMDTYYNTGIYNITTGSLTNGPASYGYGQLLVMSYRKPSGNTTTDWAMQLYSHLGSGNNGNTLYYRTSNANTWQTWQMAAHADAGTAKGGEKKPIYINAKGEIQEGSALKNLAYKDSLVASDIPNLSWNKITSDKPTTLSGYGITDAKIASGVITLGSDTITPITSIAELTGSTITAASLRTNLGLSAALRFVGVTTTDMTGGTATNHNWTGTPAGISNYTPKQGDVVINSTKQDEWVCTSVSGTTYTWERLGSDTSYKIVQSAVSDPTAASTTSTTFIDTISQNANGVISATKKTLPTASTSVAGIIKIGTASTNAMAGNTNVTNVAFTAATDDNEYPILMKYSTGSDTTAAGVKFANTANKMTTINPSTGMITAPSLTLASNAATAHLAFARAGWNYVTMPNNDSSVISIGYGTQADNTTQRLVIYKTGTVRPGANGSQNLGDDTHKWNKVYGVNFYGTFNGTATSAQQLAAREIDNSDLNQFSSGGALKYAWVGGGNSILSKPTSVNAFGVIVMKTATNWTGQLLMSTDSEPGLYWRTNLTTETPTYGSWTPLASGNGGVYYGTCATAADVAEKVVVCKHYHTLKAGDIIVVTFTNSNTQAQPTLNVNNTGAVSVKMAYSGGIVDLGSTSQLRFTYTFIYDGTYWLIINQQNAIQLATSSGNVNWRSVLLSDSNSVSENFTPSANTLGRTYAAHNVKYQPSTGTLRAPIMKTPKVQIEYDHVNKAHIEWNDTDSSIDFIFD